jgi:signal transduction histidine kinase
MIDPLALVRGLLARVLGDLVPGTDAGVDTHPRADVIPFERHASGTAAHGSDGASPTITDGTSGLEVSRRLAHEPAAIPEARRALDPLAHVVDREAFGDLRLLVTELVTNSVRHAPRESAGGIELSVAVAPHRVRAEVADRGVGLRRPLATAETPRHRAGVSTWSIT